MRDGLPLKAAAPAAAKVLHALMDAAVDCLEGKNSGVHGLENLGHLVSDNQDSTIDERRTLVELVGLANERQGDFKSLPGFALGLMWDHVAKQPGSRASTFPKEHLWKIASFMVAASRAQRERAQRVNRWFNAAFLMLDRPMAVSLATPQTVWLLASIILETTQLKSRNGTKLLAGLCRQFSFEGLPEDPFEQFLCCELARLAGLSGNLASDHPLQSVPMLRVPRFAKLSGSPASTEPDDPGEIDAPVIPMALEPYTIQNPKVG